MPNFKSDLISLDYIIDKNLFFNIPIYQRLYVWGREQIQTLLSDIWQAYKEDNPVFYLGGTLVIERGEFYPNENALRFDLIDGQQRFTTLWLISIAWQHELTDFCQQETDTYPRHRIEFAIRSEVKEFFSGILGGKRVRLPQARQLEDALEEIRSFPRNYAAENNDEKIDVAALTGYIRKSVKLVLTQVPENTDLNKLFEVINNRGVQLQHHEILKARLLKKIPANEREIYSQLWNACAYMNDYVERNLRRSTGLDVLMLYQQDEALANADDVIENLQFLIKTQQENSLSLEKVLFGNVELKHQVESNKIDDPEQPDRVRSIISFSMLLQHVLRIYLNKKFRNNAQDDADLDKISDKDLLKIFSNKGFNESTEPEDVKDFIKHLWRARYQFDKHVIKWVMVEEDETHAIRRMTVNTSNDKSYLQRSTADAAPNFALLQSMLYHSQQLTTQYWLTPLLNYLIEYGESSVELYLQHLDNHFLCAQSDANMMRRSRRFLKEPWRIEQLRRADDVLNQHFENGTDYPHYWFYKLEYVLYRHIENGEMHKASYEAFRMTAKNSVEHIAPQQPEFEKNNVSDNLLHSFGNLALVTRSINSEMSNKTFGQKQADFIARHRGKGVSLKLEYVYEKPSWDDDEIRKHQDQMIEILQRYFDNVSHQANPHIECNVNSTAS